MVQLNDFRVMAFEKKCDIITIQGAYLSQRMLADCKVFLYHVQNFFIEVFYSPKYQKVLMINAFDNSQGLNAYLESINLEELIGSTNLG